MPLAMSQAELNNLEVIYLLCWKSVNVCFNNRLSFFLSILSPATFMMLLVILRFTVQVRNMETKTYEPIDLKLHWRELLMNNTENFKTIRNFTNGDFNYNVFVSKNALAYAPNNNHAINLIMKNAATELSDITLYSFKNSEALREAMEKHNYLAGIVFTTSENPVIQNNEEVPKNLIFTLVFPGEIRALWDNCLGSHWRTNNLFDPYDKYFGRYPDYNDGGYIGYFREGFISLQHEISLAYLSLQTGTPKSELPNVFMQRFANPPSTYDRFLEKLMCCLSLAILIGYLYPTTNFIRYMVQEKSLFLKDALKIYGISETLQFVAWFVIGLVEFFVASLIALTLLKVRWFGGFGVFTKSSWTVFITFMFTYNIASVCFCYLVSTFFQSPSTAIIMHSIIWLFTYVPYTITILRLKDDTITYVMVVLFSNTAMAMGIRQVTDLEKFGNGLDWDEMFYTNKQGETLVSIGALVLILLGQSVVYMLIGMIIERNKNKTWFKYWIHCLLLWRIYLSIRNCFETKHAAAESLSPPLGSSSEIHSSKTNISSPTKISPTNLTSQLHSKTEVIEIESANKKVVVEIRDLCLIIDDVRVVDNVNMDLYENEINVLMGPNGSGKSMLLSMIIGRIPATSGSVIINGLDVTNTIELDHSYVRVVLDAEMLYPDLTVTDQITFFSFLSGYRGERLRANVQKYLKAMNLSSKANLVTHTLTRGTKQHLCACCALCGNSKFVIMDLPSSAMDMSSRKLLWDLLIKEKRRRTILITTHSTEEAEIIADRIGIMSNGKLKCFGSPFFLKTFYGTGKRLSCDKGVNCDIDAVTQFMRKYIPNISPECNLGNELTYKILQENIDIMVALLTNIEKRLKRLKLNSFTITELTFEDIFLHMLENDSRKQSKASRVKRLMNGFTKYVREYESLFFLQKDYNEQSIFKQIRAIFLRRWYYMKQHTLFAVMQFVLPVLVVYLTIFVPSSNLGKETLKPMTYQLSQYESSISVTESRNQNAKELAERYQKLIEAMGSVHMHEDTGHLTMTEYMLSGGRISNNIGAMYLIGATFSRDYIIAWFNNYPLHTIPLSLNMVHNAILQNYSSSSSITVTLEPLQITTSFDPDRMFIEVDITNAMEFYVAFVMCCICGIETLKAISERVSAFKLLQYINGLQPLAHLIGNLLFDMLKLFIIGIIIIVMIRVMKTENKNEIEISKYFVMMLMIYGFTMINFCYCVATFFNNPLTGNIAVLLFSVYGGVLFVSLSEIYEKEYTYKMDLDEIYIWVLRIFPVFALCDSLNKIVESVKLREVCADRNIYLISVVLLECEVNPNCCLKPDVLEWGNTFSIIPDIICILVFGFICMVYYFFAEYDTDIRVSSLCYENKRKEWCHAFERFFPVYTTMSHQSSVLDISTLKFVSKSSERFLSNVEPKFSILKNATPTFSIPSFFGSFKDINGWHPFTKFHCNISNHLGDMTLPLPKYLQVFDGTLS